MEHLNAHENPEHAPDVFDRMRSDHHAVLERLVDLEAAAESIGSGDGLPGDEVRVRDFVVHLQAQFATHMRAEDELLYPALASALPDTRASLAPLRGEHAELRAMLAALRATLDEPAGMARNEQLGVQARDLADLLRIHIRKEEALVFTVAERLLPKSELMALGARFVRDTATDSAHDAPARRDKKEG